MMRMKGPERVAIVPAVPSPGEAAPTLRDWAERNKMEDEATFGEFSTSLDSMGEDGSEGDLNTPPPSLRNKQDPFSGQTTTRETPAAVGSPLPEDDVVVHMMEEKLNSFKN